MTSLLTFDLHQWQLVAKEAAGGLWNLSVGEEHKGAIAEAGGVKALVDLKALQQDGALQEKQKAFFSHPWGLDFWKADSVTKEVTESSCAEARMEEITWIAAASTDTIARKEIEGQSFEGPFLIFLVPSQERASEQSHFAMINTELLFYIFYSMPRDEAQLYAANELF